MFDQNFDFSQKFLFFTKIPICDKNFDQLLNNYFRPKKPKTAISAEPFNERETNYSDHRVQKPQHTQAFLLTALKSNDFVKR